MVKFNGEVGGCSEVLGFHITLQLGEDTIQVHDYDDDDDDGADEDGGDDGDYNYVLGEELGIPYYTST